MSVIASLASGALRVSQLGAGERKKNQDLFFLFLHLECGLSLLPQASYMNPKSAV